MLAYGVFICVAFSGPSKPSSEKILKKRTKTWVKDKEYNRWQDGLGQGSK